jgi:hypothetical protein
MDANNNLLMQPNAAQTLGYALGFRPASVQSQQQEARLAKTANDNYDYQQKNKIDNYARALINGDPSGALQESMDRQFQPGFNPQEFLSSIADRATDMTSQKDPMRHGSALNAQALDNIGGTFDANPQQSEVGRMQSKQALLQKYGNAFGTGMPPTATEQLRAMLVDQLRSTRTMTREEALAQIHRYYGL